MMFLLLSLCELLLSVSPLRFFFYPPLLVGRVPNYRYILSTGLAHGCERGHDTGVISATSGGDRTVVVTRWGRPLTVPRPRASAASAAGLRIASAALANLV